MTYSKNFDKANKLHGRSRGWCFTLNNHTAEERRAVRHIDCNYIIYGKEVGDKGTPHLQGYLQFQNKKSFLQIKKLLPRAHLENTRGSIKSNVRYCSKEDPEPFEKGKRPADPQEKGRIQKEKWTNLRTLAKEGKLEDISVQNPQIWVQNYKTLKQIASDHVVRPPNLKDCCGLWVHGGFGTGKSHLVRTKYPDAFIKDPNKWWDGYQGEDVVILEDLDPTTASFQGRKFKLWADKYSFKGETKGSSTLWIRPKLFIVTSQYTPEELWPKDEKTCSAIRDRYLFTELSGKSKRVQKKRVNPFADFGTVKKKKKSEKFYLEQHFEDYGLNSEEYGKIQQAPKKFQKAPLLQRQETIVIQEEKKSQEVGDEQCSDGLVQPDPGQQSGQASL